VTSLALRALLVGLAVLVLAWLGLGARALHLEDQAEATIDRARAGPVTELDVEQARERLGEARKLSPDHGPTIKEGQLLDAAGRKAEADSIARSVTVQEPDNLQAWYLAWVAAPDAESRRAAMRTMRSLNPYIEVVLGRRNCITCQLRTP
jgi:hypothetical protein